MKKLVLAAAVAAMVGGTFAATETQKWTQWYTNRTLKTSQVLQFKAKATSEKWINLDEAKKDFGKTVKFVDEQVDGVFYYDFENEKWVAFTWSKNDSYNKEGVEIAVPSFLVFVNEDVSKALAVPQFDPCRDSWRANEDGSAEARYYGTLKTLQAKMKFEEGGTTIFVNHWYPDFTVTNLKSTFGDMTFSIKNYEKKTQGEYDEEKTEEAVNKAIDALIKKAKKVWDK